MFIGEIGINHNGDISLAKKLIDMAKRSQVDIVKFQKRDIDTCIPSSIGNQRKETPWGEMSYKEYKQKIEFGKEEYDYIDAYCRKIGIQWSASIWDIPSLEFICQYDIPFIKIPSACITDMELLTKVREKNKPVIISTGMSTEDEINKAVNILKECQLTIMHCNSSYPSDDKELDLFVIQTLKKKYPRYKIGYSGHENGVISTIVAAMIGAQVIERHITLDKEMWGTDQSSSLTESQLAYLVKSFKKIPVWLGDDKIKVYDSEKNVKLKLRKI